VKATVGQCARHAPAEKSPFGARAFDDEFLLLVFGWLNAAMQIDGRERRRK
jgi:hypothetical protein